MTKKPDQIAVDGEIIAEACAWVAQLDSGNLTGSDFAALREWMSRSPAHRREIHAIARLNGQLSVLTELAEPMRMVAATDSALRKPTWLLLMPKPSAYVLSAVCVLLAVCAMFFYAQFSVQPAKIYRTAIGEYQTIDLADGTVVKLNTDSQVEVDYSSNLRRVRLIYGEALFDVAKDPSKPFVVISEQAIAEAIGTIFVVRMHGAFTEIAVVEGSVAFSKLFKDSVLEQDEAARKSFTTDDQAKPSVPQVIINSNQAFTSNAIPESVSPSTPIRVETLSSREIQRKLSWTEGLLDFSKTRLEEVVEEVSRHNRVVIEIADPDLKDMEFGGIFRTGDVDSLLEALAGLNIRVVHGGPDRIQLYMGDNT